MLAVAEQFTVLFEAFLISELRFQRPYVSFFCAPVFARTTDPSRTDEHFP